MGRGLIEDKEALAIGVGNFEDRNGFFDLYQKLLVVPPCITVRSRIDNFVSISNDVAICVANHQTAMFFIDKIRNMD